LREDETRSNPVYQIGGIKVQVKSLKPMELKKVIENGDFAYIKIHLDE
jgi:hypothetical protein